MPLQVVHFHDGADQCVACAVQTADGASLGLPVRVQGWEHMQGTCRAHARHSMHACLRVCVTVHM